MNKTMRIEWAESISGHWLSAPMALGVVCAVYVTTLLTLHPSVFWSPDEGAKFIQMYSRLMPPEAAHRIAYGAASSDPFYVFYPAAPIYPRPVWPSGVRCHWPATFPALSLPFFRIFGVWGLYVLPLAGGIVSAALAGALARRLAPDAALAAVLLAGLGAPLLFQSVLFFEHTLACALGLGALRLGCGLGRGSPAARGGRALGALACLAALFALRDEAPLFIAAIAGAAVLALTGGRTRTCLLAGMLALALLPLGFPAKTAAAGDAGRAMALVGDAARGLAGLKDPALWRELPRHVLEVLVNNPGQSGVPLPAEWAVVGLAGLGLCAVSAIVLPAQRLRCWFCGACLVGVSSAIGLCVPDRFRAVHGLLLPMPCLVLAWLPTAGDSANRTGRTERFLTALLPVFLVVHLFATWLLRRPAGGPEWGLRYALFAYLLAAVLGAAALSRFSRTEGRGRRTAGLALAAALFVLSCGYGVRGIFEVQVTKRDLQAFEREILAADGPVFTDQWWLAAALAPVFVRTPFYTLNPGTDPRLWIEHIGSHTPVCLYVSYDAPQGTVRADRGRAAVLTQRRIVQNMTFTRYEVR